MYVYTYIYTCVRVCVCVIARLLRTFLRQAVSGKKEWSRPLFNNAIVCVLAVRAPGVGYQETSILELLSFLVDALFGKWAALV